LWLLAEANQRGDAAAADEALAEAAARPQLSRGANLLEMQVAPVAELIPDAVTRAQALFKVIGMDAATWAIEYGSLLKSCRGEGLRRPQRLPHCRTAARQVLAAATNLGEALMAQTVAERAGVPPEQQAYDAATLKAAQNALLDRSFEGGLDCASMVRINDVSVQRADLGDLALALSLLPASSASRPGAATAAR